MNLSTAPDKRLTRSSAIILYDSVPADCVERVVILLFPQAGTARSKTGEADDTISPVFERLQRRQPQDKLLLLNYAE